MGVLSRGILPFFLPVGKNLQDGLFLSYRYEKYGLQASDFQLRVAGKARKWTIKPFFIVTRNLIWPSNFYCQQKFTFYRLQKFTFYHQQKYYYFDPPFE